MFESIIQQFKHSQYDFRETANPDDPLIDLFDDWVDYYRLKWAIAHTLKPTSILEIGVRFGYSAAAFLKGSPDAHYVGIDIDSDQFGGVKGAINWAKEITRSFKADFLIEDTQTMQQFPGDIYDLIHVDGQQDGNGSFHDLEIAFQQGRFVLVDGYFWTQYNFSSVSEFLLRYADLVEWYGVIPGYAGELLIKVSESYLAQMRQRRATSQLSQGSLLADSSVQPHTLDYCTRDFSAYKSYRKYNGKKLEDPRLQAIVAIASTKHSGSLLDLGCGRGELSYFYARRGFKVSAIDKSEAAIAQTKKWFEDDPALQEKVQQKKVHFHCDNICTVELPERTYDLAIAANVIEQLSVEDVNTLYRRVSQQLKSDGLLIIHTSPNLWYYQYDYARRRRLAASIGAYLPAQPRTSNEVLMHINEQSPRVLKRQLSQHFEHVLIWFATQSNLGGSLLRKFSKQDVRSASSLFAIGSHQPINPTQIATHLHMPPLPEIPVDKIKLKARQVPTELTTNRKFSISVELTNSSDFVLNSYSPNPVHLSYHWMNEQATQRIVYGGERTKLLPPLTQASGILSFNRQVATTYQMQLQAPTQSGRYVLRLTLVQEAIRWFDDPPTYLAEDFIVTIYEP
ncbi:methyltransferase domain-containing protein [Phormidesmis sp. 146-12]